MIGKRQFYIDGSWSNPASAMTSTLSTLRRKKSVLSSAWLRRRTSTPQSLLLAEPFRTGRPHRWRSARALSRARLRRVGANDVYVELVTCATELPSNLK